MKSIISLLVVFCFTTVVEGQNIQPEEVSGVAYTPEDRQRRNMARTIPRYPDYSSGVPRGIVFYQISRAEYNSLIAQGKSDCFIQQKAVRAERGGPVTGYRLYFYRYTNGISPRQEHSVINVHGVDINVYHATSEELSHIRDILSLIEFPWHLRAFADQYKIVLVNYTDGSSPDIRRYSGGGTISCARRTHRCDESAEGGAGANGRRIEITRNTFHTSIDGRLRAYYTLLHEFGHAMQSTQPRLLPRCVSTSDRPPQGCSGAVPDRGSCGSGYPHDYGGSSHNSCSFQEQTAYAYVYYWLNISRLTAEDRSRYNDFFRRQAESRGIPFTPR